MLMEEVFERLKKFQEILTRRVELEREIRDIPKALAAQEELLSRVKKTYLEKNGLFEAGTEHLKETRGMLIEAEQAREKAESQMDAISTQREYEALNKEIRDASDREQELRRELQKDEKNIAELEEGLKKDSSIINLQESEIKEKSEKIQLEKNSKEKEIEHLRTEETRASSGIDSEVVFKFERIVRSKQGIGIVPVKGSVCTGCFMILPAEFVNEVRQGNRIVFCPYCSRVLFYQETEEQGEQLFVDIESGSLADLEDFADEGEEEGYDEDAEDSDKDEMEDNEE